MEQEFRAILLNTSGVTALVPAARINWGEHPQGTGNPYVVLTVITDAEGMTLKGPDGLSQGRVQVDIYAPTYAAGKAIQRAIRARMDGYVGGGFRLIEHAGSRDHGREGGANEAERLHRVSMDFLTHWRQT